MRTPTRKSRIAVARGERLVRPLLVAALAVGLVVSGSSAAQAQSITDIDTAGDMVGTNDEHQDPHPTPNQVRNDVLRTTMTHGATRVSIRVKYAEMRRLDDGHGQSVQMVTNEGIRRNLDMLCRFGAAGPAAPKYGEEGTGAMCGARSGTELDYMNNVIAVELPAMVCRPPPVGEVPCRCDSGSCAMATITTTPCVTPRSSGSSAILLPNPAACTERALGS